MAKGKAAVVEDEDEAPDLDELEDDDEEVDEAPAKGKSKAADEVAFGASDLAALASKMLGKEVKTKDLRTLLRKMAREDTPRINREVIPGNKSRYSWSGPDDPEVKRVLKALKGGELEQGKKEALDKLKAKKAQEKAAEAKAAKAGKKTGKAPAKAPVEDDEDFELDEDDDE